MLEFEKKLYHKIVALHGDAERLVSILEKEKVINREEQIAVAMPVINQLLETIDKLSVCIEGHIKKHKNDKVIKKEINDSITKFYNTLYMAKEKGEEIKLRINNINQ
jgi:hypothetical protein